ncbi:MAG: hypothetical protein COT84_01500 [Chlamydiae bacterium CG10_big_fil_rev_8_21_14_0_10_35_9]|nr:MAG: hypothetical protein COT84_01500 [Chlamydiae bacterium CG10_big_fil_rev_8_21_14_0_10_35_9]
MKNCSFFFLLSFILNVFCSESQVFNRVQSHLLIEDPYSALHESKNFLKTNPDAKKIWKSYIRSLAHLNREKEALKCFSKYKTAFQHEQNTDLLEEIGWSVLKNGVNSPQYTIRLAALIGAYKTRDAKAIPIFLKMMRDSHAVLRIIATKLSCEFFDKSLKNAINESFDKEKLWLAKIELIRAVGRMKLKDRVKDLTSILEDKRATFEEKHAATEALLMMHDDVSMNELTCLAKSPRAGLRMLACDIALHFQKKEASELVLQLIKDPRPDVKVTALRALGYFYYRDFSKQMLLNELKSLFNDSNPKVSITAAWVSMLVDPKYGYPKIAKWLEDPLPENQRTAAAALAACGVKGIAFAQKWLLYAKDPYVKINLALGLIGYEQLKEICCDIIFNFLNNEKEYLFLGEMEQTPFQGIVPSKIRHIDQIPNYPEALDQMTRLSLLSILAIKEDHRAKNAIQSFLLEKTWGITGFAAATLLKEGDENSLDIISELLEDPNPKVRLQAALVLALYGKDRSAIPHLEKAYEEVDHSMKLYILEAIGHVSDTSSLDFLIYAMQEPFQMRRVQAASALLQCLYH